MPRWFVTEYIETTLRTIYCEYIVICIGIVLFLIYSTYMKHYIALVGDEKNLVVYELIKEYLR